ncbi:hypothetical protein [Bacillus pacificus]|uniref:hypothetical protein n=2 Tax=Bacillus cereus group TaxID=86661 RepID=UPI001E62F014|nr:hypothetical protein [Bacillus pacificus]
MKEQKLKIMTGLEDHFELLVVEDELAEDEEAMIEEDGYNCFTIEYSEFKSSTNERSISQNIYINYFSENRDDLDEQTLDIISIVSAVKGVSFDSSNKERLQMKDTDRYIDRIVLKFKRVIPIECIRN